MVIRQEFGVNVLFGNTFKCILAFLSKRTGIVCSMFMAQLKRVFKQINTFTMQMSDSFSSILIFGLHIIVIRFFL